MKPKNDRKKSSGNAYIKYAGISGQMITIIGLGTWGGIELNSYLGYEKPIITAICAISSIFLAMYYVFRQVSK